MSKTDEAPHRGPAISDAFESQHAVRAWLVVAMLWVVGGLNFLDRVMITTMRGSIKDAIPMTESQFGLLTAVFLAVYAVLSPFAGFLADRFNRSRVICISLLAWSSITWLTAHVKTFEQLLATRALMGVSEACYIPAAVALIVDYHRGKTRSLATGLHLTGAVVGAGLGGLGGWLAERNDWTYAFKVFGLVGVGYACVLALFLRDRPPDESGGAAAHAERKDIQFGEALAGLLGSGAFILALFFWGLYGLAVWGVIGWMPTFLGEHFHMTQGAAGLSATGYLSVGALFGLPIGGAWADRWSRSNEHGRVLVPMIGLCVAAPSILLASTASLLPLALAGLFVFGLARTFTDANMMPILCLVSNPRHRATGYGVLNTFCCIAGAAAIYAGGLLRDANVNVNRVFEIASAGLLACAVLLFFVKLRIQAGEPARIPPA
jgi:MFS family permease